MQPKNRTKSKKIVKLSPCEVVEFFEHSSALLGVLLNYSDGKWSILAENGNQAVIPPERISRVGISVDQAQIGNKSWVANYISMIKSQFNQQKKRFDLEKLWNELEDSKDPVSHFILAQKIPGIKDNPIKLYAFKLALNSEQPYFKRIKGRYKKRSAKEVKDFKRQEQKKQKLREDLAILEKKIKECIEGKKQLLPPPVTYIEDFAFGKNKLPEVGELVSKLTTEEDGKGLKKRAYSLLLKCDHLNENSNIDLIKSSWYRGYVNGVEDELEEIEKKYDEIVDSFNLFESKNPILTIDSDSTYDIDDAVSCEKDDEGNLLLGVHITNVSAIVERNSKLDKGASYKGSSLYFPEKDHHMFPKKLSLDLISLVQDKKRPCISFLFKFDSELNFISGEIVQKSIIVNQKLSFTEIDNYLLGSDSNSFENPKVGETVDLLKLITHKLEQIRIKNGAFSVPRSDKKPFFNFDGKLDLKDENEGSAARKIIEELMIRTNQFAAEYCFKNEVPIIYRAQKAREEVPEDILEKTPEGPARDMLLRSTFSKSKFFVQPKAHSGVGVSHYTTVTSPIRRYVDLINQRQLIASLAEDKNYPFDKTALKKQINGIDNKLQLARQLQNSRNRYWILKFVEQKRYTKFKGIVVRLGDNKKRPLVYLIGLKAIFGFIPLEDGLNELGDEINLQLTKLIPEKGVIHLSQK